MMFLCSRLVIVSENNSDDVFKCLLFLLLHNYLAFIAILSYHSLYHLFFTRRSYYFTVLVVFPTPFNRSIHILIRVYIPSFFPSLFSSFSFFFFFFFFFLVFFLSSLSPYVLYVPSFPSLFFRTRPGYADEERFGFLF